MECRDGLWERIPLWQEKGSLTHSSGIEDSCSLSLIPSVFEGLDFEVNGLGELGVVYLVRMNFSFSY